MSVKITSKAQMYRMLARGDFGNAMPTFLDLDDALSSGVTPLGVRSLCVGDPTRLYWVPREELVGKMKEAGIYGRPNLMFYSTDYGMESSRRIQGELTREAGGLYFYYSHMHQPMRVALEQDGHHARGLAVNLLLRQHVDPGGIDWLHELLDRYPGCVIEFTSYWHPVGTFNETTLIWEVRHY